MESKTLRACTLQQCIFGGVETIVVECINRKSELGDVHPTCIGFEERDLFACGTFDKSRAKDKSTGH
jgi:hypothetical protein